MVRLTALTVVVPVLMLCVLPLPAAADDAAHVNDRASLEAFVKDARAAVDEEDPADRAALYDFADMTFRPPGPWHDDEIYLFIILEDGNIVFHAGNESREGTSLWDAMDRDGTYYTRELVEQAQMGGGFVAYWFDNPLVTGDEMEGSGSPKVSYVADVLPVDGTNYIIGSGIYPGYDPDVKAMDIEGGMDDSMLQAFVEAARDATESFDAKEDDVALELFNTLFRPEGDWRYRSIYLFVFEDDGELFFHGGNEALEGMSLWEDEDKTGTLYAQELISKAQMGGGFVEYYFDNPDVQGDEEEGSLKTSFATVVKKPSGGNWVIGSGYYHATTTPFAPPLAYLILAALLAGAGFLRRRPR